MPDLIERLRELLGSDNRLRIAILFGSTARGTARPDSDVDVAIWPEPDFSPVEESALGAKLELALGAAVDLVRIDQAAPALRWRIARDGVVLRSHPPHAASRFLARAAIEHDDLRSLEIEAARRYRARLAAATDRRP